MHTDNGGQDMQQLGLRTPGPEKTPKTAIQKLLRKTRLCVHHMNGVCRFGDRCAFAHSLSEIHDAPDLRKTQLCKAFSEGLCEDENCEFAHNHSELRSSSAFYKTTLCSWNERGKCRNGLNCRFAHGGSELRRTHPGTFVEPVPEGTEWRASEDAMLAPSPDIKRVTTNEPAKVSHFVAPHMQNLVNPSPQNRGSNIGWPSMPPKCNEDITLQQLVESVISSTSFIPRTRTPLDIIQPQTRSCERKWGVVEEPTDDFDCFVTSQMTAEMLPSGMMCEQVCVDDVKAPSYDSQHLHRHPSMSVGGFLQGHDGNGDQARTNNHNHIQEVPCKPSHMPPQTRLAASIGEPFDKCKRGGKLAPLREPAHSQQQVLPRKEVAGHLKMDMDSLMQHIAVLNKQAYMTQQQSALLKMMSSPPELQMDLDDIRHHVAVIAARCKRLQESIDSSSSPEGVQTMMSAHTSLAHAQVF
jgi:hypothetical protein